MAELRVFPGNGQKGHELANEMANRLNDVIYDYAGRVPLATALGVIEIVKIELLEAASED